MTSPPVAACPIPTPIERLKREILTRAQSTMLETVFTALEVPRVAVEAVFRAAGLEDLSPSFGIYASMTHQKIFCHLCGADPATYVGGNPTVAAAIIRNEQNIVRRYWSADV